MDQMVTDIGSRLRQAREQRGLTLRDIAATTKISAIALAAIERNDFGRLPGGVFSRAYVRAFAAEVGLDRITHETLDSLLAGPVTPVPGKGASTRTVPATGRHLKAKDRRSVPTKIT